jgi:DNA modification methylase
MPRKKTTRRQKKTDELSTLAETLKAYGLRDSGDQKQSGKHRGPPKARAVREHGDPRYAPIMAAALGKQGSVNRATHSFHTYPAGMHPDCARMIIDACPGSVHDPFCGGGTVLVEGVLSGRKVTGSDLSPIALLVSQARTSGPALASPLRSAARKIAAHAQLRIDVEVHEDLHKWYEPHVAQELGRIRDAIGDYAEEVQPLLRSVFSSIIVKSSFRKSDTSNQREPHHRPVGTTAILFHKKARELGRMLETMPESSAHIFEGNACTDTPPNRVDLILTSPPYPGVYDYLPLQQLRYLWLGISAPKSYQEIGSRRDFRAQGRQEALKEWQDRTGEWIKIQTKNLTPSGKFAIIVGDGLIGDKLVDTLFPTVEALNRCGMKVIARASADRPDHARGAIRIEHLVLAEREG